MLKWANGLRCLTSKNVKGCDCNVRVKIHKCNTYFNSVSHLAEILKQVIENEQPLLQEIKVPCKELQIDMVSKCDQVSKNQPCQRTKLPIF